MLKALNASGRDVFAINHALGFALLATAFAMFFMDKLRRAAAQSTIRADRVWLQSVGAVAAGVVIGTLVVLSSIGAGALGAATLLLLYPRLSAVKIVGTDIVHAEALALIAGLGHVVLGTVDYKSLGSLLL